jgi:hypothetical protein
VQWGINAVAAAFAIAALMMVPVWKLAILKYSQVSFKNVSVQLVSVGYGIMALSIAVIFLDFLLTNILSVYLIASQWVLGLIIYSFTVYRLDQSVRVGVRDLIVIGFGKT